MNLRLSVRFEKKKKPEMVETEARELSYVLTLGAWCYGHSPSFD